MNSGELQLAQAVRQACLAAALEAAERAGIAGICAEGRLEAALDAIRALRIEHVRVHPETGKIPDRSTPPSSGR